jgi:hypothetical protein
MMSSVTMALIELGAIRADEPVSYNMGLTAGDTLWFDAFREDGTFFHAKVAEFVSLREEVYAYDKAFAIYGSFMPAPIGHATKHGCEIFVTEGVEPRALWASPLGSSRRAQRLCNAFLEVFRVAGTVRRTAARCSHDRLLQALDDRFGNTRFAPLLADWSTPCRRSELGSLGVVPQHGDFVVNNIGTRASRLVVYDWEDFGKVSLPGLDLCTLAVSLLYMIAPDAPFIQSGPHSESMGSFVQSACAELGIATDQFWRLVPLYLLTFLYLKASYAGGIRRRIERLLEPYCASPGALAVA